MNHLRKAAKLLAAGPEDEDFLEDGTVPEETLPPEEEEDFERDPAHIAESWINGNRRDAVNLAFAGGPALAVEVYATLPVEDRDAFLQALQRHITKPPTPK